MTKFINKKGNSEDFISKKITKAITKAMRTGSGVYHAKIANLIAEEADEKFSKKESVTSSEVDKFVLKQLNEYGQNLTANAYERFKTMKEYQSTEDIIDKDVIGIVDGSNEKAISENANKDARMCSTQRDLISGTVSRSYSERKLMPTHLLHAHNEGLIHIHDTDYMMNKIHNCQLIPVKDMLWNGTVINGKMIERPKSLMTAATVASQISLSVASGQYGGQTISISHLAYYVRVSHDKWLKKYTEELGDAISKDKINELVDKRLREEVKSAVQTIQFQENTFSSTNGQTPFVSLFLWVNEEPGYEKETAMLIEETLKLRLLGMKNEHGVYVTPSFPKLLYVLDENNVPKDSEYRWLTDLAIKCSAKRMNPDYISAKKMRENYEGNVFPCMGCVDGDEVVVYKVNNELHVESFVRMWEYFDKLYGHKNQNVDDCYYIDLTNVEIYDSTVHNFVECKRVIKNKDKGDWTRIKLSNGRLLTCTMDHPLHVKDKGRTFVKDIKIGDIVECTSEVYQGTKNDITNDMAWLLGVMMCDSNYAHPCFISSFALNSENDIIEKYQNILKNIGIDTKIVERHRGVKGGYKDVTTVSINETLKERKEFRDYLVSCFGGVKKLDRKIPDFIFDSDKEIRKAFLGGIIDADGYIHSGHNMCDIEIDSTNKEMAIEEMMLANSLGYNAKIIENHYTSRGRNKIRYQVRFKCNEEILNYIICEKKKNKYNGYKSKTISDDYMVIDMSFIGNRNEYSYDVTTESDRFDVSGVASHNCRSFLAPWKDENGEYKFYGRFNRGVVTLNLVDAALSAKGDLEDFWKILDERLELVKDALILKDSLLRGTSANVSPIHWRYGSIARLGEHDTIDKYLHNGYSSISLGFIGLYEMCQALIGKSNTTPEGTELCLKVMHKLEDTANYWKENVDGLEGCSVYSTPSESLCYKFALKTRKRFGEIKNVTDRDWFTNSYHVFVEEPIDAFSKLTFESQFQKLSKGGAVSYVELPDMSKNLEALSQIIEHIYNTITYAEINTRNGGYCAECGYEGGLEITDDGEWICPKCGCKDKNKLTQSIRVCGYLNASMDINHGKMMDIKHRVQHL